MGILSVSGLSSGIDTKSLIDQLLNVERAPARVIESKKSVAQNKLSAVQAMNTKLAAFKDALEAVRDSTSFTGRQASSSADGTVGVTVTGQPVSGAMLINVKHLASAQQFATESRSTASDPIATSGSITIRAAGATADTVVAITDYSLNGIAKAVNDANVGVSAGVINDGTGYRLLLTSEKSGSANGIATFDADGDLAALLPGTSGMTEVAPAQNSLITVGDPITGLPIEGATNTLDQAIPGLKLTLKAPGNGITIAVSQDNGSAIDTAQKLVDTLNGAKSYFKSNSGYDTTTRVAGALFGDYDLRQQLSAIDSQLDKRHATQPTGYQSLSDIGITLAADGTYALDETVLQSKLSQDSKAVSNLFLAAGSAAGVPLESLTRSVNGTMAVKVDSLTSSISDMTTRITALDDSLTRRKAYYEAKFLAMEKITAQLKSQGNAITNLASSLSGSSSK